MPRRGQNQYSNPVRAAIERSSGRAYAGTRASASQRIVNDSELRRAFQPRQYSNMGTDAFYRRLGVRAEDQGRAFIRANRNSTRNMHRADRRDPNTGFGMNVRLVNRYSVGMSGS